MLLSSLFNWRILTIFAAIGPPIGALIWLFIAREDPGFSSVGQALADVPIYLVVAIPMSWVFGLVPAVLAGVLLSVAGTLLPIRVVNIKLVVVLLGTAFGYISTLAFKWLAFGMEDPGATMPLEAIGALSAAACALLVRTSWVNPNYSSRDFPSTPGE